MKNARIIPLLCAPARNRRVFKRLLILFGILLALLLAGAVYQAVGAAADRKTYCPTGAVYTVSGKQMHIYTKNKPGSRATVVFAAGWGTASPYCDFYPLYQGMGDISSFAVYDKFGYGFSDITDKPRDIDTIVGEIHTLLTLSKQQAPYVLVGHSMASLEVFRFAQKYPGEVKGIVLLDGGNPKLYAQTPPATLIGVAQRQLVNFGVARLLYKLPGFADSLNSERNALRLVPANIKKLDKTATLLMADNQNVLNEMRQSQSNAKRVIAGGKLGNMPLTILTADSFGSADASWNKSQRALKDWSVNSRQVIVKDTMHYIHQYQPQVVIREIEKMVDGT